MVVKKHTLQWRVGSVAEDSTWKHQQNRTSFHFRL